MSNPIIRVKVLPKPVIRGKMDVRFPAYVNGGNAIKITKANGGFTFDLDLLEFSKIAVANPTSDLIALVNASGDYKLISISDMLTNSIDPDLSAIAALTGTGILGRTADNTWALRQLVAPAAGITITNPAAIAGNPTFALANDLAALEGLSGTNTIYYRSGVDTWSAVTIGSLLSWSGGTLNIGDAELVALAGLTSAANKLPYFTGSGTAALADFTAFARTLLDDSDAATMRATLGSTTVGDAVFIAANAAAARTAIGAVIGTNVQAWDADLDALAALATTGLISRTGSGAVAARTITGPAAGIAVSNGDGVSGNPTLALANDLAALEGLSTAGLIARTATDTATTRSVAAGTGMSVSNGDGVSGNPTVSLANTSVTPGSYTSADITVDAQGRITSASNGGGGGGISDTDRRNALLDRIYQSKLYAQARRVINSWATGFKGASDTLNGINAGSSSNYSVNTTSGFIAPTATTDTYATVNDPTLTGDSGDNSGLNTRILIAAAQLGSNNGDRIRLTLRASSAAGNVSIQAMYIGHKGASAPNFDGSQAQVTFNGGSTTATITQGNSLVTDPVTFAFDRTKDFIIAFQVTGAIRFNASGLTGFTRYTKATSGESGTTNVTGYSSDAPVTLVDLIEVRTAAGTTNNMTLVTASQTADSSVSNGRVLLEYDNTANPTINTDLTVEVTANGGTNWTSATLSAVTSNSQDGRKVVETADTAVTSGTSFAARIKTLNNKNVPIYGATVAVH